MASRNERKRAAKAREQQLRLAVAEAFKQAEKPAIEYVGPRHDVFDAPRLLQGYRTPQERLGTISGGKFIAAKVKEPAKRALVFDKSQGKLIERRKRYI